MVYFDQILLTYTFKHYLATDMQNGEEALLSISPSGIGQLVKMLITLNKNMVYLDKICMLIHFNIDTDMLNGDEASPSISLAGFYHLVKMLI